MLFYTGIKRTASTIAETYVNDIDDSRRQLRIMKELVDEGASILGSGHDLTRFRRAAPRGVAGQAEPERQGVELRRGSDLRGGPGGGRDRRQADRRRRRRLHPVLRPARRHEAIRERLGKLLYVPFKFEFGGSQIIFFDREEDYSAEDQARSARQIDAFRELGH